MKCYWDFIFQALESELKVSHKQTLLWWVNTELYYPALYRDYCSILFFKRAGLAMLLKLTLNYLAQVSLLSDIIIFLLLFPSFSVVLRMGGVFLNPENFWIISVCVTGAGAWYVCRDQRTTFEECVLSPTMNLGYWLELWVLTHAVISSPLPYSSFFFKKKKLFQESRPIAQAGLKLLTSSYPHLHFPSAGITVSPPCPTLQTKSHCITQASLKFMTFLPQSPEW